MSNLFNRQAALLVMALLTAPSASAGPTSAQKAAAQAIDPKAQELLRQSAATYGALHSYSCRIETKLTLDSVPESRIIQIRLAFQQPDMAAVTMTKYDETREFLTDGKNLYLYLPDKKQYTQDDLPPNVPPAAPVLTQGQSFIGLVLLRPSGLADLADPARAKSLTLGPPQTLAGAEVRTVTRVFFAGGEGGSMTFFVTIGTKDHLIHRFADTIQSPKPLPMGGGNVKRIDNRETYTDIQVDPALPAAAFLPPLDAKKAAPDAH